MHNTSILMPKGPSAPVYERKRRHWNPVRIARRAALAQIPNGPPFFIPILDTTTLSPDGALDGLASLENTFQFTMDFWWVQAMVSVSQGDFEVPIFMFSMYRTFVDAQGNDDSETYQKSPIAFANVFGSAREPFELDEPIHFRPGEQIQCRIQSLVDAAEIVQIVLFGYLGEVKA